MDGSTHPPPDPADGSITGTPEPDSGRGAGRPLVQRLALLYAGWAVLAALAESAGITALPPGAPFVLAVGVALTTGLFWRLTRLPAADQPSAAGSVAAQSLMALVWTTLYACFAGGLPVLAIGMYACAVAAALPGTQLPLLRRLIAVALTAALGTAVFTATGSPAGLLGALAVAAPLLGTLTAVLLALYLTALGLAARQQRLEARVRDLQARVARAERSAERDHLTRSYNRRSILELVGREKSRVDRSGESFCICLLDIDHFKDMNDRLGHPAGDRILAAFARRVRSALRMMDSVNSSGLKSLFGRVGGEEFIVLLPATGLGGALKCAERIRTAVVRRPFEGLHQVTVSIGIAEYRPGEPVSGLIRRADEALYGAKNGGRNRVHCATHDGGPSAIIMPDLHAAS